MFNVILLRHRIRGFIRAAFIVGIVMLSGFGTSSASAQYYNNNYGYDNNYSYDSDYSYSNGYNTSSSSKSEDSDELSPFWYYVITIALFILFGAPGVAAANAATKGKLNQKTNGFASGIVNNPVNRNNNGIVGYYIEQQMRDNPNNRRG